ncbi:MAG: ABC transporter ATP-binding protein [Acidimicrobiales bacterium]
MPGEPILRVEDLEVVFARDSRPVRAVDGVSLHVPAGKVVGIVGESGSGKSVTALSILRLVKPPSAIGEHSQVEFGGADLLHMDGRALREVRGGDIGYVFQDSGDALDPVRPIGHQVAEVVRAHEQLSRREAKDKSLAILEAVGLSDAVRRFDEYPHQLSGGMRQRVNIAMALVCEPRLLIADEPTTALDVTIQAQILRLLEESRGRSGMAILLITHDIDVVGDVADYIYVMYAGRVVERGEARRILSSPAHPYTQGLLASVPTLGVSAKAATLRAISGAPPDPRSHIEGCPFAPRCPYRLERCTRETPPLRLFPDGVEAACWLEAGASRSAASGAALLGNGGAQ